MTTVIQFPERLGRTLVETVSYEVRALLGRYRVTQKDLAEWLGITQPAVSSRLRGETEWKVAEIEQMAEGFNIHPAVLMGGYAPNPPEGPLPILQGRGGAATGQPVG
ncbi:helix-turn-helix domain-containing protein [Mycobacterium sp. NPDC004974]